MRVTLYGHRSPRNACSYLDHEGKVIYSSKDGRASKNFPALEWLAAMCSHIPNRGEQMVRYYGYYSNVSRGKRKETGTDNAIPCILEPEGNAKAFRKSWARLIQKIYEVIPLVCPKCKGVMRIISFIENQQSHPGHPHASGTPAFQIKAAAENAHDHHIIRIQNLRFLRASSTPTRRRLRRP